MAVIEYYLYRIKFIKPLQIKLFIKESRPSDLFLKALEERPHIQLHQDNVWHIGNIEKFSEASGCFAIGRTTKTTVERYDDKSGNFIEMLDDSGPYTYVLFDRSIGLLGIAKKTKVAPDVQALARKIRCLFESTKIIIESGIEVRVDAIPDPENFIQKIRRAYKIKRFKAAFTGPNPIDADEIFQKPLSVYCKNLNGEKGNIEIVGDALNEDAVESVAKSVAATGNTATAKIQKKYGKKTITVQLKGDAIHIPIDAEMERKDAMIKLQESYYRVKE